MSRDAGQSTLKSQCPKILTVYPIPNIYTLYILKSHMIQEGAHEIRKETSDTGQGTRDTGQGTRHRSGHTRYAKGTRDMG